MIRQVLRIATVTIALAATCVAPQAPAGSPSSLGSGASVGSCLCTNLYRPVLCAGGVVYANACLADCAGADDCVPLGPRSPRR